MVKEANTSPISANNNIYTVDKIDKSQKFKETFHTFKNNKTDTLNTIVKLRSTPRTNLSYKSFHIEKPSNLNTDKDNKGVSDLSRQRESLASVTPDQQFITRKNKRKKTPDISVII